MNSYRAHWGLAFGIGAFGGAVMTFLLWIARLAEMTEMNLSMMMGALFTQDAGAPTWLLGFALHLLVSGLIGFIYAMIFEGWGRAGVGEGLAVAVPHTLIAGIFMLILPSIHPAVPEQPAFIAPGFLGANYGGLTMIGVIVLHLVYGAIVGGMYRVRPEHVVRPEVRRPVHAAGT